MYIVKIVATYPCHMSVVAESREAADAILLCGFSFSVCFSSLNLPLVLCSVVGISLLICLTSLNDGLRKVSGLTCP